MIPIQAKIGVFLFSLLLLGIGLLEVKFKKTLGHDFSWVLASERPVYFWYLTVISFGIGFVALILSVFLFFWR
jgi:hypothetical protein